MSEGGQKIEGIVKISEKRTAPPKKFKPQDPELLQLEQETPGFIRRYSRNYDRTAQERIRQGVGAKKAGPDMPHLHYEAIALTQKDIDAGTGILNRGAVLEEAEEVSREIEETGEYAVVGMI